MNGFSTLLVPRMLNPLFARRFIELQAAFGQIPFHRNEYGAGQHAKEGDWKNWATSAQSLVLAVYGEGAPHYQNFKDAFKACSGPDYEVRALEGIFKSAKSDFEGGYVFNVDLRVSGEVFGDFILLAKEALGAGHKDVAAVLACAALEDALKRFAASQALDIEGKAMQDIVNLLKAKGLVVGAQKTLLDAMPRIRNHALHAEWSKLSEPDVSGVIGFVEQFLLTKFSQ